MSNVVNVCMLSNCGDHLVHRWNQMYSQDGQGTWKDQETGVTVRVSSPSQLQQRKLSADYFAIQNHYPLDQFCGNNPVQVRQLLSKSIYFPMEPWIQDSSVNHGRHTWGAPWNNPSPSHFLHVHDHKRFANCAEWWVSDTSNVDHSKKLNKLSVVVSDKFFDPGHRFRIGLLLWMRDNQREFFEHFVDVYGFSNQWQFNNYRGPLPDCAKDAAVRNYRWHLSCENNAENGYVTEKFYDAAIGECRIFYWGCPNLEKDIFPELSVEAQASDMSFVRLSEKQTFKENFEIIRNHLLSSTSESEPSSDVLERLRNVKRRIMTELNLYAVVANVIGRANRELFLKNLSPIISNETNRSDFKDSCRSVATMTISSNWISSLSINAEFPNLLSDVSNDRVDVLMFGNHDFIKNACMTFSQCLQLRQQKDISSVDPRATLTMLRFESAFQKLNKVLSEYIASVLKNKNVPPQPLVLVRQQISQHLATLQNSLEPIWNSEACVLSPAGAQESLLNEFDLVDYFVLVAMPRQLVNDLKKTFEIPSFDAIIELCQKRGSWIMSFDVFQDLFINWRMARDRFAQVLVQVGQEILDTPGQTWNFVQPLDQFRFECINLERRPDRRQKTFKSWNQMLVKNRFQVSPATEGDSQPMIAPELLASTPLLHFTKAVDAQQLTSFITDAERQLFVGNDFGSRTTVIACALSHYRLWQSFLNDTPEKQWLLVFEDDIHFHPGFLYQIFQGDRWDEIARVKPDLLLFGYHLDYVNNNLLHYNQRRQTENEEFQFLQRLVEGSGFVGGAFSYMLSRDGAQRLLDWIHNVDRGIKHGIDVVMVPWRVGKNNGLRIYELIGPHFVVSSWARPGEMQTIDSDIQYDSNTISVAH